jgi:hypothetical protein
MVCQAFSCQPEPYLPLHGFGEGRSGPEHGPDLPFPPTLSLLDSGPFPSYAQIWK